METEKKLKPEHRQLTRRQLVAFVVGKIGLEDFTRLDVSSHIGVFAYLVVVLLAATAHFGSNRVLLFLTDKRASQLRTGTAIAVLPAEDTERQFHLDFGCPPRGNAFGRYAATILKFALDFSREYLQFGVKRRKDIGLEFGLDFPYPVY